MLSRLPVKDFAHHSMDLHLTLNSAAPALRSARKPEEPVRHKACETSRTFSDRSLIKRVRKDARAGFRPTGSIQR